MKKFPEVEASPRDLYEMIIAPIRSKLLLTGLELKVFNHLSEPKAANTVAKIIHAHPKNTELFLDGLTAIDLLQKEQGIYRNSPVSQAFLVEGHPTFLGQLFTIMARSHLPVLENLCELIKDGPPPTPEMILFSEEMVTQSAAILANSERIEAQEVAEMISELPEFPAFRRMLDLGGGPGLIGIAILMAHPNMTGVNFDLPSMIRETKIYIEEYGMGERMTVLGGDFNRDPIGDGYDLILAGGSLQFAKDLDQVVKKIWDALNRGGVFVSIFPFEQTNEGTKPESVVLSVLSMALMGQDTRFYQGFIADSMLRVGFKSVHSRRWNSPSGPIAVDIARK